MSHQEVFDLFYVFIPRSPPHLSRQLNHLNITFLEGKSFLNFINTSSSPDQYEFFLCSFTWDHTAEVCHTQEHDAECM